MYLTATPHKITHFICLFYPNSERSTRDKLKAPTISAQKVSRRGKAFSSFSFCGHFPGKTGKWPLSLCQCVCNIPACPPYGIRIPLCRLKCISTLSGRSENPFSRSSGIKTDLDDGRQALIETRTYIVQKYSLSPGQRITTSFWRSGRHLWQSISTVLTKIPCGGF